MPWTINEITAVSVFCKPREPWQQLSLPTKFCKVCGGHRLYRLCDDNDRDVECYDCDYAFWVSQYRKRVMNLRGRPADVQAYWLAAYKKEYGIKAEDVLTVDEAIGPIYQAPLDGIYIMGDPATLGSVAPRRALDATPIDPRKDS